MGSYIPVLRIAIVGAGPVGTACAKYLAAERVFEKIDIFEQRDRVGGIWNLSSNDWTKQIPIPQEDPMYGLDVNPCSDSKPNGHLSGNLSNCSLEFESPLYDYLEANIPKQLMQFSDTPFPDNVPLYASHQETLEYLERYADDIRHLIKFETKVQNIRYVGESTGLGHDKWEITFQDLRNKTITKYVYDAVVIANGHYTVPQVTEIPGVLEWNKSFPYAVIHSKAYRKPEEFQGQRVLVIGNSASGTDLAAQIGPLSSHLYLASRSKSIFSTDVVQPWKEDVDEIVEFLPAEKYSRAVRTKSGRIIDNLDAVIFATGYFYSFPFLSELDPPVITDGLRTRDTYQHFLHIEYPSLAFPVLNLKIIPFGLAENQAAVIARLWSGRLPVPSKNEMRDWEEQTFQTNGHGKYFHLKKFPGDAAQMNDLYRWAISASPKPGLENDGAGKLGSHWSQERVWMRSIFMNIKLAFNAKGSDRKKIRTIEELGFDYNKWREEATVEDLEKFKMARYLA